MSTYPTIFGRSCRRPRDHAAGRTARDLGGGQSYELGQLMLVRLPKSSYHWQFDAGHASPRQRRPV